MADVNRPEFLRRSVRKVSQNSYIKLRNAKTELREKVRKVSEVLRKPEHERSCADKALVKKNPDIVKTSQRNAKRLKENKDRLLEIEDESSVLAEKCDRLAELIKISEHVVVYTGAGISTAASIPDYRGPNGVWTLLKKGQELCPQDLSDAEPTYTHMSLTKLFRAKKVKHVVSQNCDGLHIRSGFPRYSLSELHGNMYIEMCYNCAPHREYVRLFDVTERTSVRRHTTSRRCRACGVNLTDTIVHFGEKGKIRSPYRWKEAVRAAKKADLILCLGSSLKVLKKYQCLWCMDKKPHLRPKLAIVNLQWTPKDDVASLKINGRCDTVMRMVMKLLDQEVPEYQREMDPIFRICTPLRASELKTTSKKILIPPSQLAKPPRQTKKSMNQGKPSVQTESQENSCGAKTQSGYEASTVPDTIAIEIDEQNKMTCCSDAKYLSSNKDFSEYKSPATVAQCSSAQETISSASFNSSPMLPQVSTTLDGNSSVSIIDLNPVCQINPDPCGVLSSSNNHLLNLSPLTTTLACTNVTTSAAQQVFMTSAHITAPLTGSSEPVILKTWPVDITDNSCEQISSSTVSVSNPEESSTELGGVPTIVVVNLDVPLESPLLSPTQNQTIMETLNSPSIISTKKESDHSSHSVSSDISAHLLDPLENISPFPVLLTYVNDQGQPLSIPVNGIPQPDRDVSEIISKTVDKKKSQFENVTLDHSYVHISGDGSKTPVNAAFSPAKEEVSHNATAVNHNSANVPSRSNYDYSQGIARSCGLNGKVRHMPEEYHRDENTVARSAHPNAMTQPDSSTSVRTSTSQNSVGLNTLGTGCSLGVRAATSNANTAPMCVLNMDEMETMYTLPGEQPHLLATTTASGSRGVEVEDITLELQLPVGCEILTMDMLSANPSSLDLPGNSDIQVFDHKAEGGWHNMNLGSVLQDMNTSEPLVNSILSSALEPVVCDLALDSVQTTEIVDRTQHAQLLSVCLNDSATSGLREFGMKELTGPRNISKGKDSSKLVIKQESTLYSTGCKKSASSWSEERKPLSPRSSELTFSSQAARLPLPLPIVKSHCDAGADKTAISCSAQSVGALKDDLGPKDQKVKKGSQSKNLCKGLLNHVKVESKQIGLENICKKNGPPKCTPSSVPGWFGKGLGLKKKRK